jgi:hypothetical protein
VSHDIDAQAELNEARHACALKALSSSDVPAAEDDLVAQMLDARHHPVDKLEAHSPRDRGVKRHENRPSMREMMAAPYGPLIDDAIARFVGGA